MHSQANMQSATVSGKNDIWALDLGYGEVRYVCDQHFGIFVNEVLDLNCLITIGMASFT